MFKCRGSSAHALSGSSKITSSTRCALTNATSRKINTSGFRCLNCAQPRIAGLSSGLPTSVRLRGQSLPLLQRHHSSSRPQRPTHHKRGEAVKVKAAADALAALGTDFLLFLGATVVVVPVFKSANQSPVLGYLFAGLLMGQLGLFRNVEEIEKLSELGVLFLLFEMGLELSLDKLRALAKYAFGLGSLQMLICTIAFVAVALPPGHGLMTIILEKGLGASPALAEIRTIDEAVVIAVALSLSSSAFVLQLLKERGELDSKFGQATLGILLFQDIATVPFLVLLPLIEGGNSIDLSSGGSELVQELAPTILKTMGGLGVVLLGGRTVLRALFELVARAQAEEVFIALCLLTVTGASLLTQRLGFSDTAGAFVSGVLLSETNFKAQVEADIQPFRGLLLGLFFVTTGASLDIALLIREWPIVLALLAGLLALKTTVISAVGPSVGLTRAESIRTGFALSQGGEFAFVLLALASQLKVLPVELNKLLIIVVVLSMAATPLLTEAGKVVADFVASKTDNKLVTQSTEDFNIKAPVLICGFGEVGQTVANILSTIDTPYVAFDLTVPRVQAAQDQGFNVLYGDGSRVKVLHAAGVGKPRAVVVGYTARARAVSAVSSLHTAFPDIPIMVRAIDIRHAGELESAGATYVACSEAEAGLAVGRRVATELGLTDTDAFTLTDALRTDMLLRSHELAETMGNKEANEGSTVRPLSIYKFDASAAKLVLSSVASMDSMDGDVSKGLLASILGSIPVSGSGSMSGSLDDETTATSSGNGVIDVEAVGVSSSNGGGNSNGSGDGGLVLLQGSQADAAEVPDGSLECPLPDWNGGGAEVEAADKATSSK